jgi:hypothetical protein
MTYTHHIPGRIRARSAAIKRNPAQAAALQQWLASLDGVKRVETNPLTGSVLIHYAEAVVRGEDLMAHMRDRQWIAKLPERPPMPRAVGARLRPAAASLERRLAKAILRFAAEVAIERSVLAIAAALL